VIDEKVGRQARVQPMAGSSTYIPLLNRGEMNFGMANVDDARTAFAGTGNFDGRPNPNLRLVTILFPLALTILVPGDSPIRKIEELKGIRMPAGFQSQLTGRVVQEAILATAGLSTADMRQVPVVNLFAGVEAMAAGRIDAATINAGIGQVQKAHADLAGRGGVRFISINTTPEAVARMQAIMPSRPMLVQPAAHRTGVQEPTWFMAYDAFITTHVGESAELVYQLTKALHANKDMLVSVGRFLSDFNPQRMVDEIGVPYHPGAIKFYTEIGQWPPRR